MINPQLYTTEKNDFVQTPFARSYKTKNHQCSDDFLSSPPFFLLLVDVLSNWERHASSCGRTLVPVPQSIPQETIRVAVPVDQLLVREPGQTDLMKRDLIEGAHQSRRSIQLHRLLSVEASKRLQGQIRMFMCEVSNGETPPARDCRRSDDMRGSTKLPPSQDFLLLPTLHSDTPWGSLTTHPLPICRLQVESAPRIGCLGGDFAVWRHPNSSSEDGFLVEVEVRGTPDRLADHVLLQRVVGQGPSIVGAICEPTHKCMLWQAEAKSTPSLAGQVRFVQSMAICDQCLLETCRKFEWPEVWREELWPAASQTLLLSVTCERHRVGEEPTLVIEGSHGLGDRLFAFSPATLAPGVRKDVPLPHLQREAQVLQQEAEEAITQLCGDAMVDQVVQPEKP